MKMVALAALCAVAGAASAQVQTRTEANFGTSKTQDGTIEYGAQSYTGQGTGFGGALGNGTIYMGADASGLSIGFRNGADLNDNATILFNVNGSGLTTQSLRNDNSDGGRASSTYGVANGTVKYPISVSYSLVFGSFGVVLFQLTNSGPINFLQFDGSSYNTGNGVKDREIKISWASLGGSAASFIDWFAYYTSGSQYMSNEGSPLSPGYGGTRDGGGNIGFGDGSDVTIGGFNRFVVPTPGSMALLGLAGLVAGRRRR